MLPRWHHCIINTMMNSLRTRTRVRSQRTGRVLPEDNGQQEPLLGLPWYGGLLGLDHAGAVALFQQAKQGHPGNQVAAPDPDSGDLLPASGSVRRTASDAQDTSRFLDG